GKRAPEADVPRACARTGRAARAAHRAGEDGAARRGLDQARSRCSLAGEPVRARGGVSSIGESPPRHFATLGAVGLRYGETIALERIDLELPAGGVVGVIGPDGVGKSSLLSLIAGARTVQQGRVHVLGADMSAARERERVVPDIAYMPQGLGKNLYP